MQYYRSYKNSSLNVTTATNDPAEPLRLYFYRLEIGEIKIDPPVLPDTQPKSTLSESARNSIKAFVMGNSKWERWGTIETLILYGGFGRNGGREGLWRCSR